MPVPDMPADKDELGFDRFAVPLARSIAATDRFTTPWTIGVYGEWGSGKTTFLKLVEKELGRIHGVRPIWFNAWKYLREENLWAALIEKILTEARRSVPWYRRFDVGLRVWRRSIDFRAGTWELLRKLVVLGFRIAAVATLVLMAVSLVPVAGNPVAGWLAGNLVLGTEWARALVGVVAALFSKPDAVMKVFDIRLGADLTAFRRRRAHRDQTALLDDFNAEFQGVLEVMYRKKPLVVIIDDLDRCLPEQTLQIIETVKLFLDEPGCVFLLAVDREIIEHAIRVKYKDLPAVGDVGETYFEKVVQLPYSLPPPAESKVESYIQSISEDSDVRDCLPILRGASPYNPRRIKRSVQAFTLVKELAADIDPVPAVLAKLVVIQAQFRQVYRAAVNDHLLLGRLERAYRQPESVEGEKDLVFVEQVKRYTEIYPALAELLRHRISAGDSFQQVNLAKYLSFVDTVGSAEQTEVRSVSTPQRSVLVMHLPEDMRWGQWLTARMANLGREVRRATPDTAADIDPNDFDYSLAVVSSASAASTEAQRQWAAAIATDTEFVGVVVEDCELPEMLDNRRVIKVAGLDEAEASNVLANALGPPSVVNEFTGTQTGPIYQIGEVHGDVHVYPGRGSIINNVPLLKPNLVERAALIEQIDQTFRSASTGLCALVGMPGSGKTVLAQQYADANASRYEVIWWLRADQFETDLAALARALDVPPDQVVNRVATFGRCLFVCDGAIDPVETVELLRQLGNGQVLVTSVHRGWADFGTLVEVGVFAAEESAQLLGSSESTTELAAAVGHLPATLAAAAAYMRNTKTTATHVVDLLGGYPDTFRAETIARTLHQVVSGKLDVRTTIQVLALLAPVEVHRELLFALVVGKTRVGMDQTLSVLYLHSLIDLRQWTVALHPALRQAFRDYLDPDGASALVERVLRRGATYLRATRDSAAAVTLLPVLAHADRLGLAAGLSDLRAGIEIATFGTCVVVATLASDEGLGKAICRELGGVADEGAYTYSMGGHHYLHRDGTDALTRLVTAPVRPDCVLVVESAAAAEEFDEQVLVALQVGVGTAIVVGQVVPSGFRLTYHADDAAGVVEQLDKVLPWKEMEPQDRYDRFEVLVLRRAAGVESGTLSLRGQTQQGRVISSGRPSTEHTETLVLEVAVSMPMVTYDRFQSDEFGNGVITRLIG